MRNKEVLQEYNKRRTQVRKFSSRSSEKHQIEDGAGTYNYDEKLKRS